MSDYRLSRRAAKDLEDLADYTIERYGIAQARTYRDSLKACFEQLAGNSKLGRKAEQLACGLRRFEHKAHIVFYTVEEDSIYVVRVLHSRMDVQRHL